NISNLGFYIWTVGAGSNITSGHFDIYNAGDTSSLFSSDSFSIISPPSSTSTTSTATSTPSISPSTSAANPSASSPSSSSGSSSSGGLDTGTIVGIVAALVSVIAILVAIWIKWPKTVTRFLSCGICTTIDDDDAPSIRRDHSVLSRYIPQRYEQLPKQYA
ncbi:hypothetical protein MMC17_004128, partial [Xylographa soralifera]|nr:hypothetical protein [Xylographa soralifera]